MIKYSLCDLFFLKGYTQSNTICCLWMGFPGGSVVKESTCQAGDTGDVGSILGSGRSTGGGNGNPLQYSCLGNSMDRGA